MPGKKRPPAGADEPLEVGVEVKARYGATGRGPFGTSWYPGKVTAVHTQSDGTWRYDILYEDGDKEEGVMAKYVKVQEAKKARSGDSPVAASSTTPSASAAAPAAAERPAPTSLPASPAAAAAPAARAERAAAPAARAERAAAAAPAATSTSATLQAGDSCKAKCQASRIGSFGTKWYPGKVRRVHPQPDGTVLYDVKYDDEESEEGVFPKFIKKWERPAPAPPRQRQARQEQTKHAATDGSTPKGTNARIVGLESRRDLNGRLCTVKSYDLKLQRYKLKLDGIADGINEKAELAVKPANIELVDEDVLHILE